MAILRKCIHTSCPCCSYNHIVISQGYRAFSLFIDLCCDRRNSGNHVFIYAECEELGSTILSKIATSGKYHIVKIAIWYYRGGSCSSVYRFLGINRKNGFGESPARWKPDERTFAWKTILLNTGGSCSGWNEEFTRSII